MGAIESWRLQRHGDVAEYVILFAGKSLNWFLQMQTEIAPCLLPYLFS